MLNFHEVPLVAFSTRGLPFRNQNVFFNPFQDRIAAEQGNGPGPRPAPQVKAPTAEQVSPVGKYDK